MNKLRATKPQSRVQQQFRDQCDINHVMSRYRSTGNLQAVPTMSQARAMYGDFSGISDYQSAMNAVVSAQDTFMQLPAATRARFGNDPHQLMSFLDDPANQPEAIKLGLVVPVPPEKPINVHVVNSAPAGTDSSAGASAPAKITTT